MYLRRFSIWMFELEISTTRERRTNFDSDGVSLGPVRSAPPLFGAPPAAGVPVGVYHGVGQASRVPDDGHRSVLEAVDLVHAARLVPRGHEVEVGPGLDLGRQPGVEGEPEGDPVPGAASGT